MSRIQTRYLLLEMDGLSKLFFHITINSETTKKSQEAHSLKSGGHRTGPDRTGKSRVFIEGGAYGRHLQAGHSLLTEPEVE
jgi:hypothetical protein